MKRTERGGLGQPIDFEELLPRLELTIGQLARLADLSVRQVSYWTAKGILSPSNQRKRVYGADALRKALLIREAREQGIGLAEATRVAEERLRHEAERLLEGRVQADGQSLGAGAEGSPGRRRRLAAEREGWGVEKGTRVATGIAGLDEMLGGGLLCGSVALVEGPPGCGKTTLALQFLVNGALTYDEPGLFISFEQTPRQIYRDAAAFGWDLPRLEHEGVLRVHYTSPDALLANLEVPGSPLSEELHRLGIARVAIDSASHFREQSEEPMRLRQIFRTLVTGLRREGVTTLLTGEGADLFGRPAPHPHGLAFVVDTVLLLRYVEVDGGIRRTILVLKMRGSDHVKEIRQFSISSPGGLAIGPAYRGNAAAVAGRGGRRPAAPRSLEVLG